MGGSAAGLVLVFLVVMGTEGPVWLLDVFFCVLVTLADPRQGGHHGNSCSWWSGRLGEKLSSTLDQNRFVLGKPDFTSGSD